MAGAADADDAAEKSDVEFLGDDELGESEGTGRASGTLELGASGTPDGRDSDTAKNHWAEIAPLSAADGQDYLSRVAAADEVATELRRDDAHWRDESERLRTEFADFVERQALPDIDDLAKLRGNRDGALDDLLRVILSGQDATAQDVKALLATKVGEIKNGVHAIDGLVDSFMRQADEVARLQRLRVEIERARQRADQATENLNEAERTLADITVQWQEKCRRSGVRAMTPAAFVDWRRQWEQAQETWLRWKEVHRKREATEALCQRHLEIWKDHRPDQQLTDSSVRELDDFIQQLQQAEVERKGGEKRLRDLTIRHADVVQQIEKIKEQRVAAKQEWDVWRTNAKLPNEWTPGLAANVAREMATFRGQVERAKDLQRRAVEMDEEVERFVGQLVQITSDLKQAFPDESQQFAMLTEQQREADAAREVFRFLDDLRERDRQCERDRKSRAARAARKKAEGK